MASATGTRDALIKRLQQERGVHSYPVSSRWYQFLNDAINFVQEAELANSPKDRFYNAWSAIRRVAMMTRQRNQVENATLTSWIKEIQTAPQVRKICESVSLDFLKSLEGAEKKLLRDERNQSRESKQYIDSWQQKIERGQVVSSEKACTHTFLIGRDLRNAVSHADFNPNSSSIRRALTGAANIYFPLSIAVIEASIEHPPEGTTGNATPYRSFLYPFLKNSDSCFSDYYLERLMFEKELSHFDNEVIKDQLKVFNREKTQRDGQLLLTNTVETTLAQWCQPVLFPALGIEAQTSTRIVTESGIYEPTGVIALPEQAAQAEYQGKAARSDLACLVWVLPWRSPSLDAIPADQEQLSEDDSPFAGLTYMEIAQRSLLGSDVPWGIVTNGRKLRLLSKSTAHKPRAFVEMDLETVIQQRGTQEGKLAFRYLLGLFAGESFTALDDKDRTRLDRVLQESERHGQEISDELKQNVFRALEELGDGFLEYMKARPDEVTAFSTAYTLEPKPSDALLREVYQESLSLMYRLLFLFYAESRDMLPMEDELYRETYSLEAIRDGIISVLDNPNPTKFFGKGSLVLWGQLQELFSLVENGGLNQNNRIPAYDGGLFDPENHPFLETFAIGDYYLARAIDLLSRTRPSKNRPRGEGRKKVTYRDLDIRHLGSIYEGILEYAAHIASEELAIMQRGSGGKKYEEYVEVSELKVDELVQFVQYKAALVEDPENPPLPSRCKIAGVKEPGQYFLVFGGRESKRKSSGSYYTPDYIVQYIVENTLGPLVRGENRESELHNKLLTSEEILELKVLDPAMGSGHFLVAATEFLARAYGEALIREGKDNDGVMSEEEFIRYKRMVAERCIYGVDINPMAVELAKLSMWLFTMDRNRPLSFLNHHLKCGNALIGSWIDDFSSLPLLVYNLKAKVPIMIGHLFQIMQKETETFQDIEAKKDLDQSIEDLKKPFKKIANAWLSPSFGEKSVDLYSYVTNINQANQYSSKKAKIHRFFHWEIAFPEIFFESNGQLLDEGGFDSIIGNPPYVFGGGLGIEDECKKYFKKRYFSGSQKINLFTLFIEQSIKLLRRNGILSLIVPNTFLRVTSYSRTREFVLKNSTIKEISDFGSGIFSNVTVGSVIIFLEKAKSEESHKLKVRLGENDEHYTISQSKFKNEGCVFNIKTSGGEFSILETLSKDAVKLGDLCKELIFGVVLTNNRDELVGNTKDTSMYKPFLEGRDISRYAIHWKKTYLLYDPRLIHRPRKPEIFEAQEKLLIQRITGGKRPLNVAYDSQQYYNKESINNLILKDNSPYSIKYILALLNSKLINWFYRTRFTNESSLTVNVSKTYLSEIPVRTINPLDEDEKSSYEFIIESVDSLLSLFGGLDVSAKIPSSISMQIEKIDQQVDRAIYNLYELSPTDVDLIERTMQ